VSCSAFFLLVGSENAQKGVLGANLPIVPVRALSLAFFKAIIPSLISACSGASFGSTSLFQSSTISQFFFWSPLLFTDRIVFCSVVYQATFRFHGALSTPRLPLPPFSKFVFTPLERMVVFRQGEQRVLCFFLH